ncbi:Uncharacterised protein [Sporosarcina pasteurii]|uniref:Uncharacterized protein n=1 Tax=Sporosarcina pasteurii TaxID=1474 RepID=A0A380CHV8_SPOPA|nr:Uncharacterised protein [Sporosarcina pasteurii]
MFAVLSSVPSWFYIIAVAVVIAFIIIAEWKTR